MESTKTTVQSESSTADAQARHVAELASDSLGEDVLLLDVKDVSSYTDYMLIATGQTERHLEFIAERLISGLRDNHLKLHHREGGRGSGWILLDFIDITVNLFTAEQRSHYDLESLWSNGREVLRLE